MGDATTIKLIMIRMQKTLAVHHFFDGLTQGLTNAASSVSRLQL